MAVYTPLTKPQLVEFLSHYDLGTLLDFQGIEAGVSNTNYFVTVNAGRFILTLFEPHRVRPEDIPFFIHYSSTLEQAGIPCPKTMVRTDGKVISVLSDRPAAMFSVLSGNGAAPATVTSDMCAQAGAMLAEMHLAAASIHEASLNHFGMNRWRTWVTNIATDMNHVAAGLYDAAKPELNWIESHWPKGLPTGAIHADYFPDNVFFSGDSLTGVIDFHFVCTDMFAYDLAIALNAWSFDVDNAFDIGRFQAFMEGYNSRRPLQDAEKEAMPALLRAASLRFLLSRIEEKLNWKEGDFMVPHDPMVFERRLRHFQSFRAA